MTTPRRPRKTTSGTQRRVTPRVAGRGAAPDEASTVQPEPSTVQPEPSTVQPEASTVQSEPSTVQSEADATEVKAPESDADVSGTDAHDADVPDTDTPDTDTPEADTPAPDADVASKPAAKTRPVARVSTLKPSTPAPTSSPDDGKRRLGRRPGRTRTATAPGRFSRPLAVALGAAAAVLAVFALIAGLHPGADIGPNKAFVDQAATTELTSQAQDKVCVAIAANGTDVDAWANKARAVLTGKALAEFNQYLPQQKQILAQTKAVADCRVDALGVSNMSGDSDGSTATIVANMIISETQNGQASNSGVPRVQFSMVKKGDAWLISEVDAF